MREIPTVRRAASLAAALAAALCCLGSVAADQAISLGAGWATYSALGTPATPNKAPPTLTPDVGAHLQVSYEHGVSREVSLRTELATAMFSGGGSSYLALTDVGIVYRFDVVKYVPYGFAGLGVVARGGEPIESGIDLVVVLGGGLDVLRSRNQSFGVEGRLASFADDITIFTLGLRASVRWGYF
jgi:hypothetical protein